MKGDKAAARTLLQRGMNVNAPQPDGATALHWAVYQDDLETADLLIRAGANVRAMNREGASVLSLACINGNADMIERLLKAGADPNERLANGETPLMLAARTGKVDAMPGVRYAYGFMDANRDGPWFGHGGGAPGMNGELRIYPDSGYVIAVLANMDPPAASRVADFIGERQPLK